MTPFLLLLLLLAGQRVSCQEEENLQYGFCEGAERPLYLAYINVQPWPVILSAGESLHILAHIYLNNTIREGSNVTLDITKTSAGQTVAVPCVNTTWGPLGSCQYDGDTFTNKRFPQFFCGPDATECHLPILPGHYGQPYDKPYNFTVNENFTTDMDWFLSGIFNIKLTVLNSDGSEFTCLEFVVSVEQKQEPTSSTVPTPGSETCEECQSEMEQILSSLVEADWLELQENYLRENACLEPGVDSLQSPACQRFIMNSWRSGYAASLYSSWRLAELTCQWFGQCQGKNKFWGCTEVSHSGHRTHQRLEPVTISRQT